MKKQNMKISSLATPLIIAFALFGSATSAVAQADPGPCSNRTLFGAYGFTIEGLILSLHGTLPTPLLLRAVALTTFDGNGKLTQVDHYVVNGMPPSDAWLPSTGTYTVNPNCTGTLTLTVPGNPLSPFNLFFVILKRGMEIHTVVDTNLVSSVGIKIE